MLVKAYGVIDLLAATYLFFADFGMLNTLKFIIIAILIVKGVPSLLA